MECLVQLLCALALLSLGCSTAPAPAQGARADAVPAATSATAIASASASSGTPAGASTALDVDDATTQALRERAAVFVERAAALEPTLTPLLVSLAEARGGELYKLEYRLKTHSSTLRKLRKLYLKDPSQRVGELSIDDPLRYTMKLRDQPPGRYLSAVRDALTTLENKGHTVVKLKNYWPTGDNYSGINTVMRAAEGLEWELQFHTPGSIAAQLDTRPMYEELRKADTRLERKRELFDAMASRWDRVPLPKDVLVPDAIHAAEQILERPRP